MRGYVMSSLMRRAARGLVGAALLTLCVAACADSSDSTVDGRPQGRLGAQERPHPRTVEPRTSDLAGSRTTAIVRAAEHVAPSVVTVLVRRTQRVQGRGFFDSFFFQERQRTISGLGSGFLIDTAGHVMTNDHVV